MLRYTNIKVVSDRVWDELVQKTYNKVYYLQQQDGCRKRGMMNITIPYESWEEEEMYDKIPEVINGNDMGVKFDVWLERNPQTPLKPTDTELEECSYFYRNSNKKDWCKDEGHINLFWERNFYPNLQTVANDLHEKGLIEAGDYKIEIDW